MMRAYDSPGGSTDRVAGSGRPDNAPLDLFDVIALAWSERGFIVLVFAVLFAIGAAASLVMIKPSYQAESRLLILLENDPTPTAAGAGGAFMLDQIMQSESELLASEAVRRMTLERLGAATILGEAVSGDATIAAMRELNGGFSTARAPYSSAMIARFETGEPDRAALILNTIVDSYLAYRQEILINSGASGLAVRRAQADEAISTSQSALDAFLQTHQLANFTADKAAAETSVSVLQDRLRTADSDRAAAQAGAEALNQRLSNIPESIELYVENDASALLLNRRVERQQLLARYQPSAPPVLAIEREIAAIETMLAGGGADGLGQRRTGVNPIRQALETDRATRLANAEAEQNRVRSLQAQLRAAQNEVARLRQIEPEYTRLAQDVAAASAAAETLAGQEAIAAARSSLGPGAADAVRVFDRATPPVSGSSMKKLALIAAFVGAAGVAMFTGLLRAYWRAYLAAGVMARFHQQTPAAPVAPAPAAHHPVETPTPYDGHAAAAYVVPQPVLSPQAQALAQRQAEAEAALADLPVLAHVADRRS